jgi:hypothetical protein
LKTIELGRYHRFILEFLLIVAGVLAALAVDDWRQSRVDVATERYILEGILADLDRDREDIGSSISVASARAAGADKLLADVGNAAAGKLQLTPWANDSNPNELSAHQAFERARLQYPAASISTTSAFRMLTAVSSMQRINVSAAGYTEASASGEVDRIRDVRLREALAQYYYTAERFGNTTDQRVDNNWLHLRNAFASGGLPSGGVISDEDILRILHDDDTLIAEIINAREFAVSQIMLNTNVLVSAENLAAFVEQALQGN